MRRTLLALLALVTLTAVTAGGDEARAACAHQGVIDGKLTCLKAGKRCAPGNQRFYKRYGFRCPRAKRGRPARLRNGSLAAQRFGDAVPVGSDGRIGRKAALEAYAASVGPLPGVRVRRGAVEADADGAVRWAGFYRDAVTPAQRAALDRRHAEIFDPAQVSAAAVPEGKTAVIEALDRLAEHLEEPLGVPVFVGNSPAGPEAYAFADEIILDGDPQCWIALTPAGQQLSGPELFATMVHEAMHCYQLKWYREAADGLDNVEGQWAWEGLAMWAEAIVAAEKFPGYHSPLVQQYWSKWMTSPEAPLLQRTYSAVGWFMHAQQSGVDPWKLAKPLILADDPDAAYTQFLAHPASGAMLDTLGPGFFRQPLAGKAWDFAGPGVPPAKPNIPTMTLKNGETKVLSAARTAAAQLRVKIEADIVVALAEGGELPGRMLDSTPLERPLTTGGPYCANPDGCVCPEGKAPPPGTLPGPVIVGLSGTAGGVSTFGFTGQSLEEYCEDAPEQPTAGTSTLTAAGTTFKKPGDCSENFTGTPNFFFAGFDSDSEDPRYFLQFTINPSDYKGPGTYPLRGSGGAASPAPNVQLSNGLGAIWETRGAPDGVVGSLTITSVGGGVITGSVSAEMTARNGSKQSASGGWICRL